MEQQILGTPSFLKSSASQLKDQNRIWLFPSFPNNVVVSSGSFYKMKNRVIWADKKKYFLISTPSCRDIKVLVLIGPVTTSEKGSPNNDSRVELPYLSYVYLKKVDSGKVSPHLNLFLKCCRGCLGCLPSFLEMGGASV